MADVFGKIMKDAVAGKKTVYKIERDDGYITEGQVNQYSATSAEWHDCEREAIELAKGKVLDIGTGAGRVLKHLQDKGIEAVGIDISKISIEICRKNGLENVYLMSASEMKFQEGEFDTVVLFGNNFGILGEPDKIVNMLSDLYRFTSDNAIILACSRDPVNTENEAHLRYHEKNREKGFLPGYVNLRLHYDGLVGDWFPLLMVGQEDMDKIAKEAGWKLGKVYTTNNLYVGVLVKK